MGNRHLTRPFEIKAVSEKGEFSGYGSVFGVEDSYGDVVIKGAFARSLEDWKAKGALPAMLWQHDTREPIGVWASMEEDDKGLAVEGRILLDAGELERRAHAHLKAGSIRGLSIGFSIPLGGLEYDKTNDVYLLKQIDLWEVSPVTFPANPEAQVDMVKAAIEGGPREVERLLRDAGFSRKQAKGLMSCGYDGLRALRDADDVGARDLAKAIEDATAALRVTRGQECTDGRDQEAARGAA